MLPEALKFQVGLIDQISKPLGNIQRQMTDVTNTYRQGTQTMVTGAAGMVGAGFALQQALMPAIEMDRALGEVKSLGVADEQLQQLSDTALKFSVKYGKSASEFVAASYDIKSAMGDLTGEELSSLSMTAAVTAAATKADTKTITDYFGTMYGIFNTQAKAIGKDAWAEQLGSYTALAVERFKTDGIKLSQSFKTLGNSATDAGVKMGEQFAVLGLLGNQMDGSVAATKYQAFISKAAGAGEKLGLNFLDSNNQLLNTAGIIDVIKSRYGDSLDALEKMELEKAFGGKEGLSFISTLYGQTGELRKQIDDFSKVKGLDQAKQMAGAMTDQWERLGQGVFAISAAFGAVLLPAILPVVGGMADGATTIIQWTQLFPELAKYIGFAAVAILGAVAAGGAFTLMMGISKQVMATYMITMKMFAGVNFLLTQGMGALRVAMLAANIAIAANPIILIVGAVIAAVAAVGALIYYWDDLKASFGDNAVFQAIEYTANSIMQAVSALYKAFEPLLSIVIWLGKMVGTVLLAGFKVLWEAVKGVFSAIGWVFSGVLDVVGVIATSVGIVIAGVIGSIGLLINGFTFVFKAIAAGWQWVMSGFTDTSGFTFIGQMADSMRNIFGSVFSWFTDKLAGIWETMKGLVDWLPGFGSDDETAPVSSKAVKSATPYAQIQPGGAAKSIANHQTSSNVYHVGGIHPTYMGNSQDMASELEMAAG